MGLNPKGRDWGALVNWDSLGKAYAGLTIGWTVLLCAGTVWLVANRKVPFIKMRNLPLALLSTTFLHIYLVKIMLAYTTNGHFLCSAEFWIMSIYLPFGIACFQAYVTQLRSISHQQRGLLRRQLSDSSTESSIFARKNITKPKQLWIRWKMLSEVQKSYIFIGVFMVLQVIMTAAIYATSPELQGDWSSYGNLPHNKGQAKCRKSLSWIPSAFWQLFWSWVYGPYVLWKIRSIRDAHHWRLQTILSIISGLPGTPLWIAAVFSMKFKPVNKWFVPPMWLAPGIIVMQFCTIFFPIWEYYEHKRAVRAIWSDSDASENRPTISEQSTASIQTKTTQHQDTSALSLVQELANHVHDGKELYRMPALEKALELNPTPLLHFAATKDFTAENIIFLLHVRQWRQAWRIAQRNPETGDHTAQSKARLFAMAVDIFCASVSEQTAEFPVNIEGYIAKGLNDIFGPHAGSSRASTSDGSDSDTLIESWNGADESRSDMWDMEMTAEGPKLLWPSESKPSLNADDKAADSVVSFPSPSPHKQNFEAEKGNQFPELDPRHVIPDIDEHVFDQAESSVKYLVLTNTWRKFVKAQEHALDV